MSARDAALAYSAAGLSCIPIRTDGSKSPVIGSWRPFQSRIMTEEEINQHFRGNVGIAVLGGEVSGNLECLDIDAPELVAPFWQLVEDEMPGLLDRITAIATPRNNHGGRHLWYRLGTPVEGNRKLAVSEPRPQFNADDTPQLDPRTGVQRLAPKTMIETRGAGGYALVPGCPGACHETGLLYEHIAGPPLTDVPTISAAEHNVLMRAARILNVHVDPQTESFRAPVNVGGASRNPEGILPGEDFNARATWEEILEPAGWTKGVTRRTFTHWCRPGKLRGTSGTTGAMSVNGTELFCCFSTNAYPFEGPNGGRPCTSYSRFAAYAVLNHGSDFSAAARALRAQGYGSPPRHQQNGHAMATPGDSDLPEVVLPGNATTISSAAGELGRLFATTGAFYTRGGAPFRACHDEGGHVYLQPIRPAALCSDLEQVARLRKAKTTNDVLILVPAICPESTARQILEAANFRQTLPEIKVISRCPVLIERGGALIQVTGFDRESGILANGEPAPDMPLVEAIQLIQDLFLDFNFSTAGDRSRAVAAIITPAMLFGGLLNARAPLDLGEADQPQSGKGFRNKITAAIYRATQKSITQRVNGGVGSVQESFDAALIAGAHFITLDNFRGKLDLPSIESFLTEDRYQARIPYSPSVEIDPRRIVIMFTSNKAELTEDLAKRSSVVRICKREIDYEFRRFPEGDLLDHVVANQPRYLGAIFAVIREWHRLGKTELPVSGHDFRRWARTLGYITERIVGVGGLLDGHREVQERTASSGLNWLRDVALAIMRAGRGDVRLRAIALAQIANEAGVVTPGAEPERDVTGEEEDWLKAAKSFGSRLAPLFSSTDIIEIGDLKIERRKSIDSAGRELKEYLFTKTTETT